MFSTFLRDKKATKVISFANDWTTNIDDNLYTKIGFVVDNVGRPDYKYLMKNGTNRRIHKMSLAKKTMQTKYELDSRMAEKVRWQKSLVMIGFGIVDLLSMCGGNDDKKKHR